MFKYVKRQYFMYMFSIQRIIIKKKHSTISISRYKNDSNIFLKYNIYEDNLH